MAQAQAYGPSFDRRPISAFTRVGDALRGAAQDEDRKKGRPVGRP